MRLKRGEDTPNIPTNLYEDGLNTAIPVPVREDGEL